MVLEQSNIEIKKKKTSIHTSHHILKINSKLIITLNVKPIYKIPKIKQVKNLCDPGLAKNFWMRHQKHDLLKKKKKITLTFSK